MKLMLMYGTAYGIIKSDTPDPLRVVIEAHVDEMDGNYIKQMVRCVSAQW
jgi:hypothetical protein